MVFYVVLYLPLFSLTVLYWFLCFLLLKTLFTKTLYFALPEIPVLLNYKMYYTATYITGPNSQGPSDLTLTFGSINTLETSLSPLTFYFLMCT